MGSYEDTISVLEAELAAVERTFAALSDDEWRMPAELVPLDPGLPHWTVFELAGHFDIALGLTWMLIAGADTSQPARDRTSFFINPRSDTALGPRSADADRSYRDGGDNQADDLQSAPPLVQR